MYCSKCGSSLTQGAKFCKNCGKAIKNTETKPENKHVPPVQYKKKNGNKLLNIWVKTPGLIKLLFIYVLINVALYYGQELYYYQDTQKMNQLESEMSSIESDAKRLETYAVGNELADPYYSQYQNDKDEYNKKANEYNELAKKSGNRWLLIPIPFGHGQTHLK